MPPVISRLSEVRLWRADLKVVGDMAWLSTFLSGTRVPVHRMVFDLINVGITSVLMEPNLRVPGIYYWGRGKHVQPVLAVINGGAYGLLPDGTAIELIACKKHMLPEDKFVENMVDVYHPDKLADNRVLASYLAPLGAANPLVLLETPMRRTMKALSKWWSGTAIVPNPSESVHVWDAVNYGDTIESWYVHATTSFMSYDDGCSHIRAWLARVYLAFATGYLVDFYGVTVSLRKVPKEFRDQHVALVISIVEMVADRFGYTVSVLHQKGPIRNMVTVFFKVVAPPRYVQVGSAVMVDEWDTLYYVKSIKARMASLVHPETKEEALVSLSKLRVCGDRVAVLAAVEVEEVEKVEEVEAVEVEEVEEKSRKRKADTLPNKAKKPKSIDPDVVKKIAAGVKKIVANDMTLYDKAYKEFDDMLRAYINDYFKRDRNRRRRQRQKQRKRLAAPSLLCDPPVATP